MRWFSSTTDNLSLPWIWDFPLSEFIYINIWGRRRGQPDRAEPFCFISQNPASEDVVPINDSACDGFLSVDICTRPYAGAYITRIQKRVRRTRQILEMGLFFGVRYRAWVEQSDSVH